MTQELISRTMRGRSTEHVLRRRDASGNELAILAKIVNDPKPNPEEVASYVRGLLQKGHIPAADARQFLATIPHDPDALRTWARNIFPLVMHQGIHAHAAFPRELYPSPPQQAAPQQAAPVAPAPGGAVPPNQ